MRPASRPDSTERLILRAWREEDAEPFARLNADPRVMECFPAPLSFEESEALRQRIMQHHATRGFGLWALERRDDGQFLGYVGLAVPRFEAVFTPCVEIGWRLAHEAWGHGYAPEAARSALTFGFDVLDLSEILSFTAVGNHRSRRVMEKLGMTHDPAENFAHPLLPPDDRLSLHVLYRLKRPA